LADDVVGGAGGGDDGASGPSGGGRFPVGGDAVSTLQKVSTLQRWNDAVLALIYSYAMAGVPGDGAPVVSGVAGCRRHTASFGLPTSYAHARQPNQADPTAGEVHRADNHNW